MRITDRVRWVRPELAAILGFVALYCAFGAVRSATLSSWPDQESPPIVLVPESVGRWSARWEPTTRRNRARPLVLRYLGDSKAPRELDLVVRVEPIEALMADSRARADADGWVRHAVDSASVLDIAEPAEVTSIAWRIGLVEPASPAATCAFVVPGDPDSENPRVWPIWAAIATFAAVGCVGIVRAMRRNPIRGSA